MIIKEISAILKSNQLEDFVGMLEDDYFDAKTTPYSLQDLSGKLELAKDCTSFANLDGGYIVVGLHADTEETLHTEKVVKLTPFNLKDYAENCRGLVKQYQDTLNQYIYPSIEKIEVNFHPNKGKEDNGLLSIYIPPQEDMKKYFLVNGLVDEDKKVTGNYFGLYIRNRSHNYPHDIYKLHSAIQYGLNAGPKIELLNENINRLTEEISQQRKTVSKEKQNNLGKNILDEIKEMENEKTSTIHSSNS